MDEFRLCGKMEASRGSHFAGKASVFVSTGKEWIMKYLLTALLMVSFSAPMFAQGREDQRLKRSAEILQEIMKTPEKGIPQDLLNKAVCVAIVPSYKKVAFGFGASGGKGSLVCRRHGDGAWSGPSMFTIGGGSFGLQIGGSATDIVMLVMNARGAEKLMASKTELGADASAAAGPVGRTSVAATDAQMHAEILTYSRARGLFAGISLQGAFMKTDGDANERLYGRKLEPRDICLNGAGGVPAPARELVAVLTKFSPHGGQRLNN
ncbi:MAG TPA: lipid-binding SYLF domain-containing protein [Terriglobia bacterium]|nr:lipid-binding SYLF domain-containing protein [Terriglobia bacterium]